MPREKIRHGRQPVKRLGGVVLWASEASGTTCNGKVCACHPEVSGAFLTPGGPLFHKAKGAAPFHSIESKDNLISIEDGDEPVHCTCSVVWTWRDVFSEDAPGVLHSSQYRVLIRVIHGTRLTERSHNARR
jgi:hypothetical protein